MSVVAFDGRTVAADCMAESAGLGFRESKIKRLDDGTILAWTGLQAVGLIMAKWYEDGEDLNCWPSSQNDKDDWTRLVVVIPSGRVYVYERFPVRMEMQQIPCAFGSGRDYAYGAMAMGADARKAVEIACQFDVNCGKGVESYDLKPLELAKAGD